MSSAKDTSQFCALLVDANASFRQGLSDIVCLYFPYIGVEEADDGPEALSKVEYLRPNIVFTEMQLPGSSGLELVKAIKEVYEDIEIVVLTESTRPEHRQQALRNGADCCISKEDRSCLEQILTRIEKTLAMSLRNT
jgi:DNA-binding NarL/FixJ family response regulator